jgi:hypothetical protein
MVIGCLSAACWIQKHAVNPCDLFKGFHPVLASPPPAALQNTDEVEYVFQLGALSILPFMAESIIEYGPARTAMAMLHQVLGDWVDWKHEGGAV